MLVSDYNFELPQHLIAQYPLPNRSDSKMLVYERNTKKITHTGIKALADWLNPGDLLVFNDSKVMPARLYGQKETGGKVEILVERILSSHQFLAHLKASKAFKKGQQVRVSSKWQISVDEKDGDLYRCTLNGDVRQMLAEVGHIPLPPYIQRSDELADTDRYQTIYARCDGSIAAPTAGLHFDEALLRTITEKQVGMAYITLHVGAGTFKPVRAEQVKEHLMHSEFIEVNEALCLAVKETKAKGGRVIAVGTTALRALESAAVSGQLKPYSGETQIFIYPGYTFQVVDGLITNFHLPQSTLLMLVAAFIGYQEVMAMYQEAVNKAYRFFSYGDVTLLV